MHQIGEMVNLILSFELQLYLDIQLSKPLNRHSCAELKFELESVHLRGKKDIDDFCQMEKVWSESFGSDAFQIGITYIIIYRNVRYTTIPLQSRNRILLRSSAFPSTIVYS